MLGFCSNTYDIYHAHHENTNKVISPGQTKNHKETKKQRNKKKKRKKERKKQKKQTNTKKDKYSTFILLIEYCCYFSFFQEKYRKDFLPEC